MQKAEVVRITIVIQTTPITMQTIKIQISKRISNRDRSMPVQAGTTTTINITIIIKIVKTQIFNHTNENLDDNYQSNRKNDRSRNANNNKCTDNTRANNNRYNNNRANNNRTNDYRFSNNRSNSGR